MEFYSQRAVSRKSRSDVLLPQQHRSSIIGQSHESDEMTSPLMTESLLSSFPDTFIAATETPFLRLAGAGKLPKSTLSRWLSQDRLYAETYICFIGSLLARVSLPFAFVLDKSQSLRWRITRMLTGALENIHRELDFFASVAAKYDLDLECTGEDDARPFMPSPATQQYMDLFRSFVTDPTLPLIEGMIVLWATEQCYFSAWTYASQFATSSPTHTDADGGALREEFIPNWTNKEFKNFVDDIAELTNLLAEREQAFKKLEVYKAVWSHVLDIERCFWPVTDDNTGFASRRS